MKNKNKRGFRKQQKLKMLTTVRKNNLKFISVNTHVGVFCYYTNRQFITVLVVVMRFQKLDYSFCIQKEQRLDFNSGLDF